MQVCAGGIRGDYCKSFRTVLSLTMMMMLFVNDIPSLRDIPQWLLHAATQEDRMGFSDLVFPCFLFCVGMSVPLSVEQRRQVRGERLPDTC